MDVEFEKYPKIEQFKRQRLVITQKIHGSNAQIYIYKDDNGDLQVIAGSRNRWLTPEDDNFGFAKFVEENKEEIINTLGVGRHYGEWAGPGINKGEGLEEKTFVYFHFWRSGMPLPDYIKMVPVLYDGPLDLSKVDEVMANLKENGSKLVEGYPHPEGVVVGFLGTNFKKVFTDEETQWSGSDKPKVIKEHVDYSHLLQPIRLEKLLSKDEKYVRDYPKSLRDIVDDYITDLQEEKQIDETANMKSLRTQVYPFVKEIVENVT